MTNPVDDPVTSVAPAVKAPARDKPHVLAALFKFGVVGTVGTVVNLVILWILHGLLGVPDTPASAVATELAILGNYLGNELWTFHHRRLNLGRAMRFNTVALGGLAITVATFFVLTRFFGLHYLLAQFVGICGGALVNFALNFGWTWRH
ncbi:MAG: GtrA family protein [Actinomycetota bacterium]|nr:GtrA family protein [Actinomycetota bacterium]